MRPDVLTEIPGKPGRFWGDHTRCVGPTHPPAWLKRLVGNGLLEAGEVLERDCEQSHSNSNIENDVR